MNDKSFTMTADKAQGEGNRLIMFFDGAEDSEIEILGKLCPCIKWKEGYYPPDRLPEFHKDWSLLMPVVEKIKFSTTYGLDIKMKMQPIDRLVKPIKFLFVCDIRNFYTFMSQPNICGDSYTSLIEATWLAVVDFIQWYNTNSNERK